MCMTVYVLKNDQFRMKCVNKYDVSTEGASRKKNYLLIDHCNLL